MKKNKMMRAASVLLILVLLTTCTISGTFAKYTTSASATDTARVAKWGISMKSSGNDTFLDTYDSTVASNDGADVVAPGTSHIATYEISGTPETDYTITFDGEATSDIYLGVGNYYYVADATDNVTYVGMGKAVAEKYYPIKYTLRIDTSLGSAEGFTAGTTYTYDTLDVALKALDSCKVSFDANEACDVKVTFGWNWAFQGQDDVADTILGDLIANNEDLGVDAGADYSLNVKYAIEMTATQVD